MPLRVRDAVLLACLLGAPVRAILGQCPDGTPAPCRGVQPGPPGLVIVPFENRSRDTADAYLAAALSDDITEAFASSHAVRLLSPRGGRGREAYRLSGGVQRIGDVVRVAVRLERPSSGEIVWTRSLDVPAARSAEAATEIARGALASMRVSTAGAVRTPARPVDPAAYDLYLRGRYFASRRVEAAIQQAVALFRQAVGRDSTFALAWSGLADALHYALRWRLSVPGLPADSLPAAILRASERALLADSAQAEIWVARADALQDVDPTSRAPSIRALERAIALDSLDASTWALLAFTLDEAGDTSGAMRAYRHSLALDPLNPLTLSNISLHFYWQGRDDSAMAWADSTVAADPTYISGRRIAGTVALSLGRWTDAETQFEAARTVGPGPERIWAMAGLAVVAVARGDSARARALSGQMEAMTDASQPALHSAVFIAWALAALGERDRALAWLERYGPVRDLHFQQHLRGDGPLAPLRADPRFQALLTGQGP